MPPVEITPISGLREEIWCRSAIRARVTWKSEITQWSRIPKHGTTLLINLLDNSGEITVVIFDDLCAAFFPRLLTGYVYDFFNFKVSKEQENLEILSNPLQIFFDDTTVVQQSTQNSDIPLVRNNFLPLSEVSGVPERMPVDVIGVCTEVRQVDERGGYIIREIMLIDGTHRPVRLNLWDKMAREFQGEVNDVIMAKGARVLSDNNEKKLNANWYTNLQINPNIPEAISLRD
ncbi:replication protein A 70 kDa DNA-binding subunit [Drosophila biarmipes]|uniref:replication protein A 70 kDa DNA-binding subunit n=1 Tax=Drosophila biarmipes TaxID=125945 RepID=UPI0007E85C63|nr:replication protein A 70 kDa DNA-binding subunit [Drosophila biarmipes]